MEYSKIIAEAENRFSNPCPQDFPLPWDLMGYIQKKWSLEAYEKLIRTCKYFYASQPWMVIDISGNYPNFCRMLNEGLKKDLKIWVAGEPKVSFSGPVFLFLCQLTSKDRFIQLLRSIRFSSLKYLSIFRRDLTYSDYILLTEFKSLKGLSLTNINVTTKNDENEICLLDDLLTPLKNIEIVMFDSENGSDYYLECAKRLTDFVVPEKFRELIINEIPEYISFEYFHFFLKKNPSLTRLELRFQTTDINNAFINDVQSFYSENLTYETSETIPQIRFEIFIGNVKIVASFHKICKNCNQGAANKLLRNCPLKKGHWICRACHDAFQPGGPCFFCLAGI